MNSTAQRCRRSAVRVRWANAPRSARQSPVGSGTSISASIASSIRSSSSSLDATCQYRDIAPAPTSRAMRRMLIASGPSASATAMAALTISSRGRPRGVRVLKRVPEERPLLLVALARAVRPARLLLLAHCCSFRRPACPNQRGQSRPGDDEIKLASSYTVLLWYTVLERTTYEERGVMMSEGPAILAEGLVKTYGRTAALAGLDLTVPAGTVYGLLGPNGAGKTTAVRVFSTLLRPNRGRAQVLGHDVVTEAARVRRMIGLTGQYAALDEYLTGRANLIMIGQLSRLTANAALRCADLLFNDTATTE